MARKKIYPTEEARLEARKGSKRNSYYKKTEKEGKPARIAILLKENEDLKNRFESMFLELKSEIAEIKSLQLKILAKQKGEI
jgi:hypothetical protein